MRIYFAHPISTYGSAEEQRVVDYFTSLGLEVVNPASKDISADFEAYRKANPETPMQFFVDLCASCQACVFTCFKDNLSHAEVPTAVRRMGSGVVAEVNSFLTREYTADVLHATVRESGTLELVPVNNLDLFTPLGVYETKVLLHVEDPRYPMPDAATKKKYQKK